MPQIKWFAICSNLDTLFKNITLYITQPNAITSAATVAHRQGANLGGKAAGTSSELRVRAHYKKRLKNAPLAFYETRSFVSTRG